MFAYYLNLGVRSLSRNPLVTILIILLIAVGVAGSITTYAMLRAVSSNPLPEQSSRLFVPQIDNRGPGTQTDRARAGPIIVTQDLANKVVANETALGKVVYVSSVPHTIVGVIANMEVPAVGTRSFAYRSILSPTRLADPDGDQYIVRAKPGQAERVRQSLAASLFSLSRMRIIDEVDGVQAFHALRSKAYSRDSGLVILLSTVCVILMLATTGGIVGVTIFWVGERHRQIGVRRALGARRVDILAYILAENFLIAAGGIVVGAVLAFAVNLALMHYLEMASLPARYIAIGSALVLILGQCAALSPARRAALVSPMEATRLAAG